MVPVLPWARGGDAERKVNVTRAWERELCWFMTVAAVARLLLPRLSIWRYYVCIRCVCGGVSLPQVEADRGPEEGSLTWCRVSRLGTSQCVRPAT